MATAKLRPGLCKSLNGKRHTIATTATTCPHPPPSVKRNASPSRSKSPSKSPIRRNLTPSLAEEDALPTSSEEETASRKQSPRKGLRDSSVAEREHPLRVARNSVYYTIEVVRELARRPKALAIGGALLLVALALLSSHHQVMEQTQAFGSRFFQQFPLLLRVERNFVWMLYWAILGAASALPLGITSYTFPTSLQPYIAKVARVALECGHTQFDVYGEEAFQCEGGSLDREGVALPNQVSLMPSIVGKVFREVFAFSIGATMADVLVYLLSRFASVAPNPLTGLMKIKGPFAVFAVSLNPVLTALCPVLAGFSTVDTDDFYVGSTIARLLSNLLRALFVVFLMTDQAVELVISKLLAHHDDVAVGVEHAHGHEHGQPVVQWLKASIKEYIQESQFRVRSTRSLQYGTPEKILNGSVLAVLVVVFVQAMRVASKSYNSARRR